MTPAKRGLSLSEWIMVVGRGFHGCDRDRGPGHPNRAGGNKLHG